MTPTDAVLEEIHRDVFETPRPTLDLDYLCSVKKQVQGFADVANAQLKKNVYQNYSLFIESSRDISALKEEMKLLNTHLDEQITSMNALLDQLNKAMIIQPAATTIRFEHSDSVSKVELPSWLTKSPDDFDVLIAQRNLREAVELAQDIDKKMKLYMEQNPGCFENKQQADLKAKIDTRLEELVNSICSELQPANERSLQGGLKSSIESIQLLRKLNLSSRAVKLYLDQRSTILHFVLNQQKIDTIPTVQFVKQVCAVFFHHIVETCVEFKKAFEVEESIKEVHQECVERSGIRIQDASNSKGDRISFKSLSAIYRSVHPPIDELSPTYDGGISPHDNKEDDSPTFLKKPRRVFYSLSTYSSLIYWVVQEFENFCRLFHKLALASPQQSVSTVAECYHHLKSQCARIANHTEIDTSPIVEKKLAAEIRKLIEDGGKKLIETMNKLNAEEDWQPYQFASPVQLNRFLDEMNEVQLTTMSSYIFEDLKLRFTAAKTSFARTFLIMINDFAKLVSQHNKDHIDSVISKTFELEMEHVIDSLKKAKVASKVRFIMGNSNFLLDKVILVADSQYFTITGQNCTRLTDLRVKYQAKVKSVANI